MMRKDRIGKAVTWFGVFMLALMVATFATAAPVITGQAVDKIVIGSTSKAEVVSMFGPPQKTEAIGAEEVMYYQTKKEDPITKGNICNIATITIAKNGKVKNVVFQRYCEVP
jgi:outer membrane protein assembly factor BamE (lipoprotein component of BamABCDE complex)